MVIGLTDIWKFLMHIPPQSFGPFRPFQMSFEVLYLFFIFFLLFRRHFLVENFLNQDFMHWTFVIIGGWLKAWNQKIYLEGPLYKKNQNISKEGFFRILDPYLKMDKFLKRNESFFKIYGSKAPTTCYFLPGGGFYTKFLKFFVWMWNSRREGPLAFCPTLFSFFFFLFLFFCWFGAGAQTLHFNTTKIDNHNKWGGLWPKYVNEVGLNKLDPNVVNRTLVQPILGSI